MINVTIYPNATATVTIEGGAYPLSAPTSGQVRNEAIDLIARYAQHTGQAQSVCVVDSGQTLELTITDAKLVSPLTAGTRSGVTDPEPRHAVELHRPGGSFETIDSDAVIGRHPDVSRARSGQGIQLHPTNRTSSNTHAFINVGAGGITLTDLGSSNGTYITREGAHLQLSHGVPVPIYQADLVHIGDETFDVRMRAGVSGQVA